jgi:hypothetical protein
MLFHSKPVSLLGAIPSYANRFVLKIIIRSIDKIKIRDYHQNTCPLGKAYANWEFILVMNLGVFMVFNRTSAPQASVESKNHCRSCLAVANAHAVVMTMACSLVGHDQL